MGSGLISSFGRRMSYAPSLFPTLDLVCGAAFPGEGMGSEKWLRLLYYGAALQVLRGTRYAASPAQVLLIEEVGWR